MHIFIMIFRVTGREDEVTLGPDFSVLLGSQNSVGGGWCILEANADLQSFQRQEIPKNIAVIKDFLMLS